MVVIVIPKPSLELVFSFSELLLSILEESVIFLVLSSI